MGNGNPCLSHATLSHVRTSVCQVVRRLVVFGVIIGKIVGTCVLIEMDLSLGFMTSEPMDLHANHFNAACDDGVINKFNCS